MGFIKKNLLRVKSKVNSKVKKRFEIFKMTLLT